MSAQKNVGWVRLKAVTHQNKATEQNEWPVLPIEQVADVNPRIDKSAIPDDLPVSFVPMPSVGAGDGSIHVEETRPAGEVKKGFTAFLEGDVLFAKITPCMENGKMAVVPKLVNGYGFGSTEFHVLRPKPEMDAKYLYYYVSSQLFRGEAERYMTGAVGQKRVSTDYLKRSKIPIAPLDQQKRIVAEIEKQFSRLDEAVANLKRVKANLKRYKAAVLKAAVEGRLVETEAELARRAAQGSANVAGGRMPGATEGRSYETGAQLLQRILETRRSQWKGKGKYKEPAAPDTTDLPELPEGWVWTSLDSLIADGPQNGLYLPKSLYGSGHPILRIDDYQQDWIRPVAQLQRVRAKPEDIATYSLRSEDLVINRVNSPSHLGKVAVWSAGPEMPIFESNMMRTALSPLVAPLYVATYLRSVDGRTRLTKQAKWAVNQASINQQDVCGTPVPLPPHTEQIRIVEEVDRRLTLVREVEGQVDANHTRAERLRQTILHTAFSGGLNATGSEFGRETQHRKLGALSATGLSL